MHVGGDVAVMQRLPPNVDLSKWPCRNFWALAADALNPISLCKTILYKEMYD